MPIKQLLAEKINKCKDTNCSTRKKMRKSKNRKNGGRGKYKDMWCSQAIVSQARVKCVKTCRKKKQYKADTKKELQLNKQYDAFLAKTCKADDDDSGCIQKNREGNPLFDQIIKLERKNGKFMDTCMSKECSKDELERLQDCINLGEEQCRAKYADLIKKSKKKILPLEVCNPH